MHSFCMTWTTPGETVFICPAQSAILKAFNIEKPIVFFKYFIFNLKCSRYRWSVYGLKTRSGSKSGNRGRTRVH